MILCRYGRITYNNHIISFMPLSLLKHSILLCPRRTTWSKHSVIVRKSLHRRLMENFQHGDHGHTKISNAFWQFDWFVCLFEIVLPLLLERGFVVTIWFFGLTSIIFHHWCRRQQWSKRSRKNSCRRLADCQIGSVQVALLDVVLFLPAFWKFGLYWWTLALEHV